MTTSLSAFKQASTPLPETYKLWPLYGAGFENLGKDGQMIDVLLPEPGPDQLLVRHDAVGICFSDIKVIRAGQNHPRIYRKMSESPVVLGHEVALTVVKAGANLQAHYHPGDRFIIQADIVVNGVGIAYGYEMQGGFSQYNIIDQRVLNGDGGNYLLPLQPTTGYAEAALNEPWACVLASYQVSYRTTWKEGGTLYIGGDGRGVQLGTAAQWRPGKIVLQVSDNNFNTQVHNWARPLGIPVTVKDEDSSSKFDDIVIVGSDADLAERMFARLAKGGVFNVVSGAGWHRNAQLDIGRLHYDQLALIGTDQSDLSAAYTPIRAELKKDGVAWMLGAAGPMGQMHVQRAVEMPSGPRKVVASNLGWARMAVLEQKMTPTARQHAVELVCVSEEQFPSASDMLHRLREETGGEGFDDVVVIAANAATAEMAMPLMREGGVMNVFAGLPRGTLSAFDLSMVTQKGVRFTGISGSSIEDLQQILDLTESHQIATNRSVVAIAGLEGVPAGLASVRDGVFPGKVVIYPQISGLPLTPITELKEKLPTVFAKLESDGSWTNEAEAELLLVML